MQTNENNGDTSGKGEQRTRSPSQALIIEWAGCASGTEKIEKALKLSCIQIQQVPSTIGINGRKS